MKLVPAQPRNSRIYYLALSRLESALDPGEPVLGWSWEGIGLTGWIVATVATIEQPDTPVNNVTMRTYRQLLFSFRDIRDLFLPTVTDEQCRRLFMRFDETFAYVDLNREER